MSVVKAEMPNGAICFYRHEDHSYWKGHDPEKGTCSGRLSGVTNISKNNGSPSVDGLLDWAVRLANEGKDWRAEQGEKGDLGQGAHDLLECLARDLPCEPGTLQERAVQEWWNGKHLVPRGIEEIVYSPAYGYAGRYDLFAEENYTPQLWDLKTSTYVRPEHFIQLNLYELARREVGFIPAKELWILHVDRQGAYHEVAVPVRPEWAFHAISIHNSGKEIRSLIRKASKESAGVS